MEWLWHPRTWWLTLSGIVVVAAMVARLLGADDVQAAKAQATPGFDFSASDADGTLIWDAPSARVMRFEVNALQAAIVTRDCHLIFSAGYGPREIGKILSSGVRPPPSWIQCDRHVVCGDQVWVEHHRWMTATLSSGEVMDVGSAGYFAACP